MSTVEHLYREALELSADDQDRLLDLLMSARSYESDDERRELLMELDRRDAEMESGADAGSSWEDVKASAMRRIDASRASSHLA